MGRKAKVVEPVEVKPLFVSTLPYSFIEHAMDWQKGERVTLAEFDQRQEARKPKRSKRNANKA